MNMRLFTILGAVSTLALAACTITTDTNGGDGGAGGGATTTNPTTSSSVGVGGSGGGGGAGGGTGCDETLRCSVFTDTNDADPNDLCGFLSPTDTDSSGALYDAWVACAEDADAGCGAGDKCGDDISNPANPVACDECIKDQTGPCATQFTACYSDVNP